MDNNKIYNLLIVEDDTSIRNSLLAYFEDLEFEVFDAEDGETAVDILRKQKIHVAIVDLRLPGISGEDVVCQIIDKQDNTGILIHTGSPEFALPKELLSNPCVSKKIFEKPVESISELYNEIINIIGICN